MENDLQRDKLIEKMFDAALKEKFSQLGRKYKWELVLKVWAEIARCQGSKPYFNKGVWKLEMTIMEALDSLDAYSGDSGRPFRSIPATYSDLFRPAVPGDSGRPVGAERRWS